MLVLAVMLSAVAVATAGVICRPLIASAPPSLMVRNYSGREVPAVGGLVILATFLLSESVLTLVGLLQPGLLGGGANMTVDPSALPRSFLSADHFGIVLVVLGFFALGSIDDLSGAGQAKGFKGHFSELRRGNVTGGAIKALGGGAIAFLAGGLWELELGPALIDAAIIALTANLINLFDLRPGRATKVFFIGWVPLAIAGIAEPYLPISAPVAAAAGIWLWADLKERAMLGDAGANLLGGALGSCICLAIDGTAKSATLAFLIAMTALSEKFSFTEIIDNNSALSWMDRLGRVRE